LELIHHGAVGHDEGDERYPVVLRRDPMALGQARRVEVEDNCVGSEILTLALPEEDENQGRDYGHENADPVYPREAPAVNVGVRPLVPEEVVDLVHHVSTPSSEQTRS